MKHTWIRDQNGKVQLFGDEYEYAECRLCGDSSATWPSPEDLDNDDCEDLDTTIAFTVTIAHPGKATEYDDGSSVSQRVSIPLAEFMLSSSPPGAVIAKLAEAVLAEFGAVQSAHAEHWARAIATPPADPEARLMGEGDH